FRQQRPQIRYFQVVLSSSILSRELYIAGFKMQNYKFQYTTYEDVKVRLPDHLVIDESNYFQTIYRFEHLLASDVHN
ncbi:hypothetical protein AB4371_22115, partial [Vibrio sp. 10N.261.51.A3]|uniref:hypothetical protein n=1 Tax=Vibrio sp. 10N.261.51.A3 TaxID=3229673 RepID=UPI003552CE71